jgi:hypothetical protein
MPYKLNISLPYFYIYFSISLSFFSAIGKEVRRQREVMGGDVGSCKGGHQFYSAMV